ncbi:MAG TPA: 3-isopropylmalate dehydratase [Bryobacteraceae bacterium]|nr:3-isopropylmalate dehydratase [Bryobacteraceae bacterium]
MAKPLVFEGTCWKFGHNIPTDLITPTHITLRSIPEMAKHVLEAANPDFPKKVQPGDIIVAGRNFGCSSGRAIAPKAIKATGVSVIVAELFARTFYRNGHEIGLPLLEAPGIHELAGTGDRLRVDVVSGTVENLSSGKFLRGNPAPEFLLEMLQAGGLIPLLKTGSRFFAAASPEASSQEAKL